MIFVYSNTKVYYEFVGGETVNIFLHGWGRDHTDFEELKKALGSGYLTLDFPPFGESAKPKNWSIFTYANMVICLCRHLKIKKCNIIGHSFGGRVAIIVSAMEKDLIENLVLLSSAGMKPKRSLKFKLNKVRYKILKKLHRNTSKFGSKDYLNLDDNMKSTFISIVSTHLEDTAKLIEAKTLIIFGVLDTETPVYMAKRLSKLIKNSKLVLISSAGHFCFLEKKILVASEIKKFLGGG